MISIPEDEIEWTAGCTAVHPENMGGQHVAMSCTGVRARHKPTGLWVLVTEERSQYRNKEIARGLLCSKVEASRRTTYEKIVEGLVILGSYLSKDNQGEICAEHDELFAHGAHRDAIGGDDLAKLEGMGWRWDQSLGCWRRFT